MTASIKTNLLALSTSRHLTAHYAKLSDSVRRLSSGLRVERAADDAAGLAIRELMRADVASLHQGARNVDDAISLIQTADGALGVIDEKFIRMKELAEQAATGTYDSTQRLMIDSEFQQMASEIERIARATDFNGIHLLDGSLSGSHDGSQMEASGALKVHFGTGNDSAEDYYYIQIGDATLAGLGLVDPEDNGIIYNGYGNVPSLDEAFTTGVWDISILDSQVPVPIIKAVAIIPVGVDVTINLSENITSHQSAIGQLAVQIFTRSGEHLIGTPVNRWNYKNFNTPYGPAVDPVDFITPENGFLPDAVYDASKLNGNGRPLPTDSDFQDFTINGMEAGYTGDGALIPGPLGTSEEKMYINNVNEELIVILAGFDGYAFMAEWNVSGKAPGEIADGGLMSIKTQELAQKGIVRLDAAIVRKDQIRSHLGAVQNRLENTVSNLNIQAENLQAAESRISDADIAAEMTTFVRNQVMTQTATAMLSQANSFPHMLLQLIGN